MGVEYDRKYVEPIINASRPWTLVGLSLTVLRFSADDLMILRLVLIIGAIMFLLSSFFIFFFSIYPARRILWTGTTATFLLGLVCSILSSKILLIIV